MTATVRHGDGVHTVVAEPLDRTTFAPFGVVLSREGHQRRPHALYGDRIETYVPAPIDASQPLEWFYCFARVRPFRITFLERHHEIAQAFVPLGGAPMVLAVAAPDCALEQEVPAFDAVRAFLIPGSVGVQIHRGTWHEPPFPLVDESAALITSHRRLSDGLVAGLDEQHEIRALDVDKRNITERTGQILRIRLP